MVTAESRPRPSGLVVGSLVAISFGTVFVLVNSGGLADPWRLLVRTLGVLVAAALLGALVLVARRAPAVAAQPATGFMDRRYWLVVAAEAVALFGGLAVVNNVLHRPSVAVAWVAFVVGVHFFGLGRVWRMSRFHRLGAAMTALGLAGFLTDALGGGAAAVALVAGVGSGVALFVTVALALREAVRAGAAAG
ncbi:hypothetical protein ACFO0M_02835 [Micromonospora mangrovi]|uniref:Uncharacterized protein n=2 Tax=Micromonospora TaxID=1873 RepID=A0AAU8H6L2_9ACTN